MKKNIFRPLSTLGFLGLLLLFSACGASFIPYNTTITVQSQRLSDATLAEKRVLIVSYDNNLTRDFVISLKNYVQLELKNHKVVAERINIRQYERSDIDDFNKLKNTFKPDYLLTIKTHDERTRNFYMIGKSVKKLRGITVDFNLMSSMPEADGLLIWKSEAIINHFYDTEGVATAKKIAKELGVKMKKDALVNQ
jgi:hypothetical protein